MKTPPRRTTVTFGSRVYRNCTDIEVQFLACWERWAGDPWPEHEYYYVPGRKFRADFAWSTARVIVECEGGVTTGQAHGSISGVLRDIQRANFAAANGWLRFRIWSGMLQDWAQAEEFIRIVAETVKKTR